MPVDEPDAPSLPIELLPSILDVLAASNRVSDLAALCLVCRSWRTWALPRLWRRIWLRDARRVRTVFSVLRTRPDLCKLVKVLELRVYPLGLMAEDLEELETAVASSLRSMSNLEELCWTRQGSLNDRLLPDLVRNKSKLQHLELTGSTRYWAASAPMLWQGVPGDGGGDRYLFPFPALRSLSLILPDAIAMHLVLEIASRVSLSSLFLLFQHSSVFLPVHADLLAPHLEQLERLVLVGSKRLDGPSLRTLVRATKGKLRCLAVEGCASVHPSILPALAPALGSSLETLTLTLPRPALCAHADFYSHLADLVQGLDRLQELTLYAPGGLRGGGGGGEEDDLDDGAEQDDAPQADASLAPKLPLSFVRTLTSSRPSLTLLRIHGIVASTESLRLIAQGCRQLRDLVVQLESTIPAADGQGEGVAAILAPLSPSLHTLHILARAGAPCELDEADVLALAKKTRALRQVGFRNRVWEVQRGVGKRQENEEVSSSSGEDDVALKRWDASEGRWPEAAVSVVETDEAFGAFDPAAARGRRRRA